jgi:biopolymer transport protein ExbD
MIGLPAAGDDRDSSFITDLTSLIDVVFIVLVFLLLSANPALLAIDVELPRADAPAANIETPLTIHVQSGDTPYALNDRMLPSLEALDSALQAGAVNQPIVIAAERDAPVERLIQLLSLLQNRSIPAAQILTETP